MSERELNSLCNKIAAGAKYAVMASTELKAMCQRKPKVYRRYAVANAKRIYTLRASKYQKLREVKNEQLI